MNIETTHLRREEIYQRLRAEILSCTLAPGANLHEAELAERFAISKSPIRDALMRLEAERLVLVAPRKGYRVAPISVSDARDLFGLRMVLEQAAAPDVAANASESDLKTLDRFRSLAAWGGGDFVTYNREFHCAVVELCSNRRIAETGRSVIEQFDRLVVMSISTLAERNTESLIAEHAAIIDALQARDGRLAARLLQKHIEFGVKRVLKSLEQAAVIP
ncbi:GntR family transcriptional regulator [Ferrovibrio sp.]|uniref:GntR family transcriptional regulator n=1 Tax=Ferrovibrio sp. TaxID=1917215 RepID=UPI003D0ACDB8